MLRRLLLLLLLAADLLPVRAQILTPTTLTTALSQPTAPVGTELDLLIKARIQPKWHLYATDFDPNVGPAVFTLTFTKSPAYALVGKPTSVGSKHLHDDVFNGEVAIFENTALIRQRIKVLRPGPLTIRATAEYQSCSDADGRCVPGTDALSFGPLRVGSSAKLKAGAVLPAHARAALPPSGAASAAVAVSAPAALPAPASPAPPAALAAAASVPAAPAVKAALPAVVVPAVAAMPTAGGLWSFGLLAFLSGLAALLTPCVFPLVPLTVSLFTGGAAS